MKYINYSEFKITKEYQKICGKNTLSDLSDRYSYNSLANNYTRIFHNGYFRRAWDRCRARKKRRIEASTKRSNNTLNIYGRNTYGLLRGHAFNTKMKNKKFDAIFKKHLRDTGWYSDHKKKR